MADVMWVLSHVQWFDVVDILLVATAFYFFFSLAQGTQAVTLLRGVVLVILVAFVVSRVLPFKGFGWLVQNALPALLVAIPVIFQPELRRALDRLGRTGRLFGRWQQVAVEQTIQELVQATLQLARQRHGALIALERETGLREFVERGVVINADVKAELLQTVFHPNTALHDKAVIIRGGQIVAAGCLLPVTHDPQYSRLGTRHRAAIGLSEETDAMAIVVSEETGTISVAYNGRIIRDIHEFQLRDFLLAFFQHRLGGRDWPPAE